MRLKWESRYRVLAALNVRRRKTCLGNREASVTADKDIKSLIFINVILTFYLIVGTYLEEKKTCQGIWRKIPDLSKEGADAHTI